MMINITNVSFYVVVVVQKTFVGIEMTPMKCNLNYFVMGLRFAAMVLASATTLLTWNK